MNKIKIEFVIFSFLIMGIFKTGSILFEEASLFFEKTSIESLMVNSDKKQSMKSFCIKTKELAPIVGAYSTIKWPALGMPVDSLTDTDSVSVGLQMCDYLTKLDSLDHLYEVKNL